MRHSYTRPAIWRLELEDFMSKSENVMSKSSGSKTKPFFIWYISNLKLYKYIHLHFNYIIFEVNSLKSHNCIKKDKQNFEKHMIRQ